MSPKRRRRPNGPTDDAATPRQAYIVQDGESLEGGVLFASSAVEARRIGADLFGGGDLRGMIVRRAHWADQYAATGVPARELVAFGWQFECAGCDRTINAGQLANRGIAIDAIVGVDGGDVFCCDSCQMLALERRRREDDTRTDAAARLAEWIRGRVPGARVLLASDRFAERPHVRVRGEIGGPTLIEGAIVSFRLPETGAAVHWIRYEPFTSVIGPHVPNFRSPNPDATIALHRCLARRRPPRRR
jgi:hypothetical protein